MPFAAINGARLWFEVRGTGEPLLLHHGYTASRVNWMPIAERLEDRYQIILMECRGTGESEHTAGGYSLEQYALDVVGMADYLELERISFAGHSMGGGIGYVLGLDHADRLNRLILMAPVPANGLSDVNSEQRARRRALRLARDRDGMLARNRALRFRPEVETDAWLEDRVEHVLGVSDGHYDDSLRSMGELRAGDRLHTLSTPTLMLAGAVDSLLFDNLSDFMQLPNATIEVLARAGHEVAIHEPDRVAEAIDAFMTHGAVTAADLTAALEGSTPYREA
jgi:pimeloyl-ACP methyl ester carboxylesterase